MTPFWKFSQKMTYFDQIDPINDIFDQIYVHKLDWNNFYQLLEIKFFVHFRKILTYDVILHPKWPNLEHFHQKWPILTRFSPLMAFWTKFMFINLTEINFSNIERKYFWPFSVYFNLWSHCGSNMTQFGAFWPKMTHFGGKMTS